MAMLMPKARISRTVKLETAISARVPADELAHAVRCSCRPGHNRLIRQVPPDIAGQFRCRRVAALFVLLQRLPGDDLDVAAIAAVNRAERLRIVFPDDAHDFRKRAALRFIRKFAGQQLVQDHAERVDVAANIHGERVAQRLFGAHVVEGADKLSQIGLARRLQVAINHTRHAEVQDLRLAGLVHQDVAGLKVAMQNAALVGVTDGIGNLRHEFQPGSGVQGMSGGIIQ
jgi:hypothetical protein